VTQGASGGSGGAASPQNHDGPLVLLVDDYPDALDLYADYLRERGFRVCLAENGRQALEIALREPPHVVVMDLFMPVMDGEQATRRLREEPSTKSVAVIALTARDRNESGLAATLAAGLFDALLTKPCLPEDLLAAIEAARERPRP